MLGLEIVIAGAVSVVIYRHNSSTCHKGPPKITQGPQATITSEIMMRRLEDKVKRNKLDHSDSEDEDGERKCKEEEEVFGSGLFGVDMGSMVYHNEKVTCVSLYEETIKPRSIMPILHPYVLCETPRWIYVLEKWRDGLAVSRFRRKEQAVRSRGKWFGRARAAHRRMPTLVQSTTEVQLNTNELLAWSVISPTFKQYTDNCHTFAANLCKRVNLDNPNTLIEDLIYDEY